MEPQTLLNSKDVSGMQRFLESQLYHYVEFAVGNNDAAMIRMLIDRESVNPFTNVEQFINNGYDMLIKAIDKRALEAAMELIKYGVKVYAPINDGHTPLRCCLNNGKNFVEQSCLPIIRALISNGALDGTVEDGVPVADDALEHAVNLDSSILVNLFTEHGANVHMTVIEEDFPLVLFAAKCCKVEAMLALVRKGARADVTDPHGAGILYNFFMGLSDTYSGPEKNSEKYKLGHGCSYVDIVTELIEAGANPALSDGVNVRPLGVLGVGYFNFQEYTQIADILLLHGASLNDVVYDDLIYDMPQDVLEVALEDMHYQRVKYWLEKGASADYEVHFMEQENLDLTFYEFIDEHLRKEHDEDLIIRISTLLLRWGATLSYTLDLTLRHSTREYCKVLYFFLTFCIENDSEALDAFIANFSNFSEDQKALVQDFFQQRKTAFFMADHARLGSESHLRSLPRELLEYIFDDKI